MTGYKEVYFVDQTILASFHVTVTSTDHASWQGYVEIGGVKHTFKSELQLLRRVMEQYPALRPDAEQRPK